jgi:DNA repair exonuclease SbcCD ATPase subunit
MSKHIDYLFEDPEIPTQKFALVSIVGPHMKQKCDVWGLKIRGVAESIDTAKNLCKRLLRIDNNYDIYTVEVGKFFPLNVDPLQVQDVEYQNDQLNTLIKSYLENRQNADELWHKRKAEMIEDAIKEGKNQEEFANKPEHPISVLHRIKNYKDAIEETNKTLNQLQKDLQYAEIKFDKYSQEEKDEALQQLQNIKKQNELNTQSFSVEEVHKEIEQEINSENTLENIITKIKSFEDERSELLIVKQQLSQSSSPKVYDRIQKSLLEIDDQINELKQKLNDKNLVNNYINENYPNPQYNFD